MKPITPATARQIALMWIDGHTYEAIAEKADVGTGTVSNVIQDFRAGGMPEFEGLREAAEEVRDALRRARERGLGASELVIGGALLSQVMDANIPLSDVGRLLLLVKDLASESGDRDSFLAAAAELSGERQRTGRSWADLRIQVAKDQKSAEEAAALRAKRESESEQAKAERDKLLEETRAAKREASTWGKKVEEVRSVEARLAEMRGELGAVRRELASADAAAGKARTELAEAQKGLEHLLKETRDARVQEEDARKRLAEVLAVEAELGAIRRKIDECGERERTLQVQCSEEQGRLDGIRSRLSALVSFEPEASDLARARNRILGEITALEKIKARLLAEEQSLEEQVSEMRDDVAATMYLTQFMASPTSPLPDRFWEALEHLVNIKRGRKPNLRSLEPRLQQIVVTGLRAMLLRVNQGKFVHVEAYEKLRLQAENLEKRLASSIPKDRHLIAQRENEALQEEDDRLKVEVAAAKEKVAAIDGVFRVTNPCTCGAMMTYVLAEGITYTEMLNSGRKFEATCPKCGRKAPLTAAQFCLRVGHTLLTTLRG